MQYTWWSLQLNVDDRQLQPRVSFFNRKRHRRRFASIVAIHVCLSLSVILLMLLNSSKTTSLIAVNATPSEIWHVKHFEVT